MKQGTHNTGKEESSSWRSLSQELGGPAITPIAQKRRRFVLQKRVVGIVIVLTILIGLGYTGHYLSTHSSTFAPYAQAQNKTKIEFFSDGQLTASWFDENYSTLKQSGLLSIDIAALQARLLENPQVMEATVERRFPSSLRIQIKERIPMARLRIREEGKIATLYLARDGRFFQSESFVPDATLPFLSGVKLRREPPPSPGATSGFAPLVGSIALAELLDGLKSKFPDLYIQISQIDLSEWIFPVSPQTSVSLMTRNGTRLRFGTQEMAIQLSRLGETLELMKVEGQQPNNKFIDLAYTDRVSITELSGKQATSKGVKK